MDSILKAVARALFAECVAVVILSRDGRPNLVAHLGAGDFAASDRDVLFATAASVPGVLAIENHSLELGSVLFESASFVTADGRRGALCAFLHDPRRLSRAQTYLFEAFARQVAAALDNGSDAKRTHVELLETVVAGVRDAVIVREITSTRTDQNKITYVNAAFTQLTGYDSQEAFGQTAEFLVGAKTSLVARGLIRSALETFNVLDLELVNYRKDGSTFWAEVSFAPIADTDGAFTHWIVARREVSERKSRGLERPLSYDPELGKSSEARLAYYASCDQLTGLWNRAHFMNCLELAMERGRSAPSYGFAVILIDLNRFREINEAFDYKSGDLLLRSVARKLGGCTRAGDTLARTGDNEFAILVDPANDVINAVTVAERVGAEFAERIVVEKNRLTVSARIGIAQWSERYRDGEHLMRDASIAMHRTRDAMSDPYLVFTESMHEQEAAAALLQIELRNALDRDELKVYYQPLVDVAASRVYGFEALLRWQHPERGLVSPLDFIPLAEETGLIIPIGAWILRQAIDKAHDWQQFADGSLLMSVNVSSRQFYDPHFFANVEDALRTSGLEPSNLQLEITESVFLGGSTIVTKLLERIRGLGVRIALDDFGTGYSSLSYLERNQIDALKIDQSFVARVGDTSAKSEIVRMIVALSNSLGLEVIAEGVETEAQSAALVALGCTHLQGYHYSRPLPEESVATEFMTHWARHPQLENVLRGGTLDDAGPQLTPAEKRELVTQIRLAIETHGLWKHRLRMAVQRGVSTLRPEVVAREDLCPIGIWLTQTISDKLKRTPLYAVTLARHAVFHRSAARLLALALERDPSAEAALAPGGDFTMVTATLFKALTDWLTVFGVTATGAERPQATLRANL